MGGIEIRPRTVSKNHFILFTGIPRAQRGYDDSAKQEKDDVQCFSFSFWAFVRNCVILILIDIVCGFITLPCKGTWAAAKCIEREKLTGRDGLSFNILGRLIWASFESLPSSLPVLLS